MVAVENRIDSCRIDSPRDGLLVFILIGGTRAILVIARQRDRTLAHDNPEMRGPHRVEHGGSGIKRAEKQIACCNRLMGHLSKGTRTGSDQLHAGTVEALFHRHRGISLRRH